MCTLINVIEEPYVECYTGFFMCTLINVIEESFYSVC